jgi:hypothetical protein
VNSREECLSEAAECDRLASLANTLATRNMMRVAAFHWRKLAEKAAERQKTYGQLPALLHCLALTLSASEPFGFLRHPSA